MLRYVAIGGFVTCRCCPGDLRIQIGKTFSLDNIVAAHRCIRATIKFLGDAPATDEMHDQRDHGKCAALPAVDRDTLKYLNRLSDALFIWSRWANHQLGIPETLWPPSKAASARTQR